MVDDWRRKGELARAGTRRTTAGFGDFGREVTPSWMTEPFPAGLWGVGQAQAARPPIAQITPYTQQIMQRPEYQARALGLPPEKPEKKEPEFDPWAVGPPVGLPAEKAPEGYDWRWDSASGRYVLVPRPGAARISQAEIRRIELAEEEAERQQAQWEQQQAWQEEQWGAQQEWQRQQQRWQEEQWEAEQEATQRWQEQQMELERERMAWQQEEAERVERARLSAQPQSWLQYASYMGETPGIQPWMLPLMPQQYQELGAGGAIPGWTPEGGAGMPELARPSRQLQARMGPTALAQYGGYQQARTGIRPEEQAWRMGATAPPGGRQRQLQYAR